MIWPTIMVPTHFPDADGDLSDHNVGNILDGTRPLSRCYHDKMTLESLLKPV